MHLLLFCIVLLCQIEGTGTLKKTQVYLLTTIYMKLRCLTLGWWHFKLPGAGIIPVILHWLSDFLHSMVVYHMQVMPQSSLFSSHDVGLVMT